MTPIGSENHYPPGVFLPVHVPCVPCVPRLPQCLFTGTGTVPVRFPVLANRARGGIYAKWSSVVQPSFETTMAVVVGKLAQIRQMRCKG